MSFTPPPVIPQSPEQARQRDHHAGLDTGMAQNPVHELARLRHAIREHRDTVDSPSDHDRALWAHLPESSE